MLVLSRKIGERIYIGDASDPEKRIVLTVIDIDYGKVRIGIQAPKEVAIFREELLPPRPSMAKEDPKSEKK